MLSPRFIPDSVFYTQFAVLSPRFILTGLLVLGVRERGWGAVVAVTVEVEVLVAVALFVLVVVLRKIVMPTNQVHYRILTMVLPRLHISMT